MTPPPIPLPLSRYPHVIASAAKRSRGISPPGPVYPRPPLSSRRDLALVQRGGGDPSRPPLRCSSHKSLPPCRRLREYQSYPSTDIRPLPKFPLPCYPPSMKDSLSNVQSRPTPPAMPALPIRCPREEPVPCRRLQESIPPPAFDCTTFFQTNPTPETNNLRHGFDIPNRILCTPNRTTK